MKRLAMLLLLVSPMSAEEAMVNGFRMYYEARGKGEPVVFLHGFSLDSRMWEGQQGLAKKYRVIVADMRYHGRSEAPEKSENSVAESAADVVGLLDHLNIDGAHLVGLSMGGGIALETALRYPERVRSLTLVASGVEGVPFSKEAAARFVKYMGLHKEKGAAAFREALLSDPLFVGVRKNPKLTRQVRAMMEAFNVDKALAGNRKPSPRSQLERLPEVKTPTLVMIGALDVPDIIKADEAAAQGIPGARKIVYPDAGHMINMERPKKFNRDLEAFLKGLPREGRPII